MDLLPELLLQLPLELLLVLVLLLLLLLLLYAFITSLGGACRSGEVVSDVAVKVRQRAHEKRKWVRASLSKRENARWRLQNRAWDRPSDLKSSPIALAGRKNAAWAREALRFFLKWARTKPVGARKCAAEAQ